MTIPVRCAACGKTHQIDEAHEGRRGKCSRCGAIIVVARADPDVEDDPGPDGYALDDPAPAPVSIRRPPVDAPSTFVRAPKPSTRVTTRKADRDRGPSKLTRGVLIGAGVGAMVLVLLALLVPGGRNLAAFVLAGLGLAMMIIGYGVGAYAAFSEDSLYGFLYLLIPLYTAYYIVSRFDDLWRWAALVLAGIVLVGIAGALIEAGLGDEAAGRGIVARRSVELAARAR